MGEQKIIAVVTGMIAFSTFLGVLAAIIYYLYQIRDVGFVEAVLWGMFYIDINLIFLYILKNWME